MKILKTIQKVPGGLMVVPLFLGAIVNLVFPQFLDLGGPPPLSNPEPLLLSEPA